MTKRLFVIGASGLARESRMWCDRAGLLDEIRYSWGGFVVTDRSLLGPNSEQVAGDEEWLTQLGRNAAAVIGFADPAGRSAVGNRLLEAGIDLPNVIDPQATVGGSSIVGEGSVVTAGCVVTVDVRINRHCFLNINTTVGHGTSIGEGSVINPGCSVSGDVTIGRAVLVGTGSAILERISIGDGATVGAGAVVTRDVMPGEVVVGVPARPRSR